MTFFLYLPSFPQFTSSLLSFVQCPFNFLLEPPSFSQTEVLIQSLAVLLSLYDPSCHGDVELDSQSPEMSFLGVHIWIIYDQKLV